TPRARPSAEHVPGAVVRADLRSGHRRGQSRYEAQTGRRADRPGLRAYGYPPRRARFHFPPPGFLGGGGWGRIRGPEYYFLVRKNESWRLDIHLVFYRNFPAREWPAYFWSGNLRAFPSPANTRRAVSLAREHLVGWASGAARRRILYSLHAGKRACVAGTGIHGANYAKQTKDDHGNDRGESRILPRSPGQDRPGRDDSDAAESRDRCPDVDDGGEQVRRGGNARGSQALRGAVPRKGGTDRRRDRHPAEFRRRAGHRRHPAPGAPARSGAGAGHSRYAREDGHHAPPRQLLRQDVRVQQPAPVQHSVFADHAAYGESGFRGIREGPGVVRRRLPHREGFAEPAHRSHRRAANGVQHGALQ